MNAKLTAFSKGMKKISEKVYFNSQRYLNMCIRMIFVFQYCQLKNNLVCSRPCKYTRIGLLVHKKMFQYWPILGQSSSLGPDQVYVTSPRLWNALPRNIREAKSLCSKRCWSLTFIQNADLLCVYTLLCFSTFCTLI